MSCLATGGSSHVKCFKLLFSIKSSKIYFGNIVHPSMSLKDAYDQSSDIHHVTWAHQPEQTCNGPATFIFAFQTLVCSGLSFSLLFKWDIAALVVGFGMPVIERDHQPFSSDFVEYVSHLCVNAASEESIQLPLCESSLGCGQKQYSSTNFSTVTTD